jgi:hypothetical protein
MNTAAMQAGKAAANARKALEHAAAQRAYMGWVKEESLAYRRLTIAREFGDESAHDAERLWQATLRAMPKPPPDHAWS